MKTCVIFIQILLISLSIRNSAGSICTPYNIIPSGSSIRVDPNLPEIKFPIINLGTGNSSNEISFFLTLNIAQNRNSILEIVNISKRIDSAKTFFPLMNIRFDIGENDFIIEFYNENTNTQKPLITKANLNMQSIELNTNYFLSFSLNLTSKEGSIFMAQDFEDSSLNSFHWSEGSLSSLDLNADKLNLSTKNSDLFKRFSVPKSTSDKNIFSHFIRVMPGCTLKANAPACSSMNVSDFQIFFQSTKYPNLLPLATRSPSFVADYSFDFYDKIQVIQPSFKVSNSSIKAEQWSLKSSSNLPISDYAGLDISSHLPHLNLEKVEIEDRISFSLEVNFSKWKTTEEITNELKQENDNSSFNSGISKSVSIMTISSLDGNRLFSISLDESPTNNGTNSGYELKSSFYFSNTQSQSFEIPKSFIQKLRSISNKIPQNSNKNFTETSQNLRLMVQFEKMSNDTIQLHLFVIGPRDSSSDQSIAKFSMLSVPTQKFESPVSVIFFQKSDSLGHLPPIHNLNLSRIMISDSIQNIIPNLIRDQKSTQFLKCHSECYIKSPSLLSQNSLSNESCWQCKNTFVLDQSSGKCLPFCVFRKKNVSGNCITCLYPDCSDSHENLFLDFKLENNKKIISASNGVYQYKDDFYKNHFDLFLIKEGYPDEKIDFETKALESNRYGAEIIPNSSKLSELSEKSNGYKLSLKPSKHVASLNRTLYHTQNLEILNDSPSNFISTIDPIHSNIHRTVSTSALVPMSAVSTNTSPFIGNIMVDKAYQKCKFNDKIMRNLALALFIIVCIGNALYIIYSLFIWNKSLIFQLPTLATVLCVHMNCLYQALIFCTFYEVSLPPSLDAFLKHSYYYAIHWHGAFRSVALKNLNENRFFLVDYYRSLFPKRDQLGVVQNIFINFGVILLIWLFVWLISIGCYFVFRKTIMIYSNDYTQYFNWKYKSFINRIAICFVWKLAFFVWIIFSVEFSFFFINDLIRPSYKHHFFIVSFAFSIIFLILHFVMICFLLYIPIYLNEYLGFPFSTKKNSVQIFPNPTERIIDSPDEKPLPIPTNKDITTKDKGAISTKKANALSLEKGSIHYNHLTYITSKAHHKYNLLFALQGLKTRYFGVGNLGVTAFFFTFYGIIISATYNHPRIGVTINFVILIILFAYLILSQPGFHFIPRILLYVAYFIFIVAKLLFLLIVYDIFKNSKGKSICHFGTAILALLFASICFLFLGLLASLFFSFKFKNYFLNLFFKDGVLVKAIEQPMYLVPDEDKSLMEQPIQRDIERPSQMIRRFRESKNLLIKDPEISKDKNIQSIWKGVEKIMASQKRIEEDIKFKRVHLKHLESKSYKNHKNIDQREQTDGRKIIKDVITIKPQTPEEINSNMDESEQYYVNDNNRSRNSFNSYSESRDSHPKSSKYSEKMKREKYHKNQNYVASREIPTNIENKKKVVKVTKKYEERERNEEDMRDIRRRKNYDVYKTRDRNEENIKEIKRNIEYDTRDRVEDNSRNMRRMEETNYVEKGYEEEYKERDSDREKTKRFIEKNMPKREYRREYYKPRKLEKKIKSQTKNVTNKEEIIEEETMVKEKNINNVNQFFDRMINKKKKYEVDQIEERKDQYTGNSRLKADEESRYNSQYY